MLSQISQVLDVKPVANVSPKWIVNRPIQAVGAARQIGEHGPDYAYEKPSPATKEAVLNCGCSLFFPVAPMTGELLFCARHDDWYKSQPARTNPKTSYFVRCPGCPREFGPFVKANAYTSARRHSFGKNGNKPIPCKVFIGRTTQDSTVVWTEYKRREN